MAWNTRPLLSLFVSLLAFLGAAGTAASADMLPEVEAAPPAREWTLSLTPYGWLTYITGDQTIRGRTVGLNIDPIEVLEHLDTPPWMSYAELRRGRLALYNDIVYANLDADASAARTFGQTALSATLGVDFEQAIVELGGAYEVYRWSSGGSLKDPQAFTRSTALDILAGARYWYQNMAIHLAVDIVGDLPGSTGRFIAREGVVDWVDPVVGARIRHEIAPGQGLLLRADIGGFDVGSKFSWNVLAAYSYDFKVRDGVTYSGVLGYRALDVDYEQGSGLHKYEYDVLQHGPLVGFTIKY